MSTNTEDTERTNLTYNPSAQGDGISITPSYFHTDSMDQAGTHENAKQAKKIQGSWGTLDKFIFWMTSVFDDSTWAILLLVTIFVYMFTCALFGLFYYLCEELYEHYIWDPVLKEENDLFCISNILTAGSDEKVSFLAMMQFSFETQTTIGYGYRYVTEHCTLAVFLTWLQTIVFTAILQPILVGFIIRKLMKPIDEDNELKNKHTLARMMVRSTKKISQMMVGSQRSSVGNTPRESHLKLKKNMSGLSVRSTHDGKAVTLSSIDE